MPVYFVQPVDGGPIKIGHSVNVPARIKQLELAYARPLAVLGTMPGGRDEEQAIHARFAHLRFDRTEQFRPEPELLDFIGRPLFVSAAPVVEAMSCEDAVIVMSCHQAYKDWIGKFAARKRVNPATLVDIALLNLANVHGFEPPPDRLKPRKR